MKTLLLVISSTLFMACGEDSSSVNDSLKTNTYKFIGASITSDVYSNQYNVEGALLITLENLADGKYRVTQSGIGIMSIEGASSTVGCKEGQDVTEFELDKDGFVKNEKSIETCKDKVTTTGSQTGDQPVLLSHKWEMKGNDMIVITKAFVMTLSGYEGEYKYLYKSY